MKISINGKNLEVSEYISDVATKKLSKLNRYFAENTPVQVNLAVEKNRHIVEVTIPYEGRILRAEESTADMYASLDNVVYKLEKQVERLRTRSAKEHRAKQPVSDVPFIPMEEEEEAKAPRIVRNKRFEIRPMSEEEAMLQMEMLGHSFFVFENAQTGEINVLYTRKDGNYGLIEPA